MTRRMIWTTAVLVAGGMLSSATVGIAAADDTATAPGPLPAPLPAEAPAPTGQTIVPPGFMTSLGNVLAQSGSDKAGPLGLPDMSSHGVDFLLAQNWAPAAPGSGTLAGIYPMNPWEANYLLPQTVSPALPGQGTPAPGIGPDADSPGTGRIAMLRRLHEMWAAGELKGSLLGQMPPEEFEANLAEANAAPGPAH